LVASVRSHRVLHKQDGYKDGSEGDPIHYGIAENEIGQ